MSGLEDRMARLEVRVNKLYMLLEAVYDACEKAEERASKEDSP